MVVGMKDHDYVVRSTSTGEFGRVLLNARDQHLVVDGPAHNGCPGEAITPAELFLGGVAACGVELVSAIARDDGVAVSSLEAEVAGTIDRSHDVRSDVTVFQSVALKFVFRDVGYEDAARLVETFKSR
jgi:uncharacterized OsmC-like protein